MRAIGNVEVREALSEKQHWEGADEEWDRKLTFEEIVWLCRRLKINSNQEDLSRLSRGGLSAFRSLLHHMFMSLLVSEQTRSNADSWTSMIFGGLSSCSREDRILFIGCIRNSSVDSGGVIDSATFEKFMRDKQKVCLVFLPLGGGCLTTRSPHSIEL